MLDAVRQSLEQAAVYQMRRGMVKRKTQRKIKAVDDSVVCKACGIEAKDAYHATYFTWQNIGKGRVALHCWACADKLHKETLAEGREYNV